MDSKVGGSIAQSSCETVDPVLWFTSSSIQLLPDEVTYFALGKVGWPPGMGSNRSSALC